MHGWWSLAYPNISRMSLALSPMYLSTIAEETTFKKFASMLLAMALANRVLPVPGGPYNNTPCHRCYTKTNKSSSSTSNTKEKDDEKKNEE
jgi:hypothetical protein